MSRSRPQEIEFVAADDPELMGRVVALAVGGTGWVNIEPIIDEEYEPPPPGPFAFLGGSTHKVPLVTWVPGRRQPDGSARPSTIGVQHAAGPRLAWRLRSEGPAVPEGWRITQDHPRRGLVISVPALSDPATVVAWLLEVAERVCQVRMTGRWRALIHTGTG